ncbi:MAG: hypothetical protein PVH03_10380 [Chloroflexota bacterium]|jgi:hypothetical protein
MASQESRDFRNMELGDQSDQTIPNKGWFMYFRLYGVQQVFFDNSWQLPLIGR